MKSTNSTIGNILFGLWVIFFLVAMTMQIGKWFSLSLPAVIAQSIFWAFLSIALIPLIAQMIWSFLKKGLFPDENYKIDEEVSWYYGRNFWLGLLFLLLSIFFFYVIFWGIPYYIFGVTMSETRNAILPFVPMLAQILPLFLVLPFIYLFGFYGPFILKIFIVDVKFHFPYWRKGITFDDIIGQDQAIQQIKMKLRAHRNFEEFRKIGGKPRFNMIFAGPPGVGKTLAAKAIADSQGKPFIEVLPSITYQTFIGVDIIALWIVFFLADLFSFLLDGCYVFFDEFENLARARNPSGPYVFNAPNGAKRGFIRYMPFPYGAMGTGGATTLLLAKLSGAGVGASIWYLLPQMFVNGILDASYVASGGIFFPPRLKTNIFNGLLNFLRLPKKFRFNNYIYLRLQPKKSSPSRVIYIGATNMFEALDEAIKNRPERFQTIDFEMPGLAERLKFINYFLDVKKFPHHPNLDSQKKRLSFARACEGLNFDQLEQCFHTAQQESFETASAVGKKPDRETVAVTIEELTDARNLLKHGFAKPGRISKEAVEKIAYHESGHLVAQKYCDKDGTRVPVHFSAVRRSRSLGRLETPEEYPEDPHEQEFWEAEIRILLASHAAEREFFGSNTTGVIQDLSLATLIACKMVNNWGMWAMSDEDESEKELDKYAKIGAKLLSFGFTLGSQMYVREIVSAPEKKREIQVILGKAYNDAERIVKKNKKAIRESVLVLKKHKWEMGGINLEKFYLGLKLNPIEKTDPWADIDLANPFYEKKQQVGER